jgi:hypothetical protein
VAGPILAVAVWINRYSKYWQEQFDALAGALNEIDNKGSRGRKGARRKTRRKQAETRA